MAVEGYEEKVPACVRRENDEKVARFAAEVAAATAAVEEFKRLV
jgi:hypothetical protein